MAAPKINAYRFGHIEIDGQSYTSDVIIFPDHVMSGWWRQEGHVLYPTDLESVFEADVEALIVGQGAYGRMRVTQATRRKVKSAGIDLIVQHTHDAVETYNAMREEKNVVAALHLTC
ncbi:MAG: Mth938-like domain-containing protein [Anaerolineae bacterium]